MAMKKPTREEQEERSRRDAERVRGNRFRMDTLVGPSTSKAVLADALGNFLFKRNGQPLREAVPMSKEVLMARTEGCCRKVWNLGLDSLDADLSAGRRVAGYGALCRRLTAWKAEFPWLEEVPHHALQQALRELSRAYQKWLSGKAGKPSFKGRGEPVTIRFPDPEQFSYDPARGSVTLPKFGEVFVRGARPLEGEILSCSITVEADGSRFVSLPTRTPDPRRRPALPAAALSACGLDFGVAGATGQAILDDGTILGPSALQERRMARKMRYVEKQQRRLARCQKGSRNRKKNKTGIAMAHRRISDIRMDATHRASAWIAERFSLVAVEDSSSRSLIELSSAEHKPSLASRLQASLWHPLKTQILYKVREAGGTAVLVPAYHTSCTCVNEECSNYLKHDASWRVGKSFSCPACGTAEDSEVHAARTMLVLGKLQSARPEEILGADEPRGQGGASRPSREPRPGGGLPPEGTLLSPFVRKNPARRSKAASGG